MSIPEPKRELDKPFIMPIEDVFSIKGRGTVATGRIEAGVVKINEEVEIVGIRPTKKSVVTGIEAFKKNLDQGQAGDNAGIPLRGIERDDIERGQVLAKPGSITLTPSLTRSLRTCKEEGGRHTPFFIQASVLLPHHGRYWRGLNSQPTKKWSCQATL